jgi:digeranylgeranylglycerophospholipid reductase
MADPITGAGIHNAMLAGDVAGKTIIDALEQDDIELLPIMKREFAGCLGSHMEGGWRKERKWMPVRLL